MPTSKSRVRPNLVDLESRDTPATIWVSDDRWVDEPGTLPRAVRIANETAGKDVIQFAFAAFGKNDLTFASNKTLEVAEEVSIELGWNVGAGKSVTISGTKPFTFTHKTNFDNPPIGEPGTPPPTPSSAIIGVNFKNCNAGGSGGAVEVTGGNLMLTQCQFVDNTAGSKGGAVMVGENCLLTVSSGCLFDHNTANYGGAIANSGQVVLNGTVFADNEANAIVIGPLFGAQGGWGGAIYSTGVVISDGSQFNYNYASRGGGGVYIANSSKAVENASTFTGGQFANNSVGRNNVGVVETGDGGGLNAESGFVRVTGTAFYGNMAGNGGGLSAGANSTVEIKSATFGGNSTPPFAANGPYHGRAIDVTAGAFVSVQGSTFDGNGIRGTYYNNGGNTFTDSPDE